MNEKTKVKAAVKELDFQQLVSSLARRGWIIVLASILGAVLTLAGTFFLVTPRYESSAMFYVNNSSISLSGITASDLSAAQELVESYIVILESREALLDIIEYAGVDRTYSELRSMISASSVNSTEIFEVVVVSPDPYEAQKIADAVTQVLPKRINSIIDGTTAKVVDTPIVASRPASPSYPLNTIIGFLAGVLCSVAAIVLYELFDITVRGEEDVQRICRHPILANVPDMTVQTKGGYYERDFRKKVAPGKETVLLGPGISFAAAESYKLLRTKLQFSFADEQKCRVIGVSSALAGEGKSLSSVNMAYALAQLDKKVLLIDCDMRRPSLNHKLAIQKIPGLSNYLTHQVDWREVPQRYGTEDCTFDVVSSGRNPPNPIELLSSDGMAALLQQLRGCYDYIILDLPPVGEVSDALVAAKLVDGVLLVVRQNYCTSVALSSAVSQFAFVETRILGVVINCATENGSRYGYGRAYKAYRSHYATARVTSSNQTDS